MKIINSPVEFQETMEQNRRQNLTVGFVPTMGYLHEGHLSLVDQSKKENDVTALSIFVNPTQFNVPADLANYPRDLERDLKLLESRGTDLVFVPQVDQIYKSQLNNPLKQPLNVTVPWINAVFEGAHRPGHFDGVSVIILKLFSLAGRCKAYFGLKDYQQVILIEELVKELFIPIQIVKCETVRGVGGLALSSRNVRLTEEQVQIATELYRSMSEGVKLIKGRDEKLQICSAQTVSQFITDRISQFKEIELEYVNLVNEGTLDQVELIEGPVRILIAAKIGPVRLIDNMGSEDLESHDSKGNLSETAATGNSNSKSGMSNFKSGAFEVVG